MNQDLKKPLDEFTEKQTEAYRKVMRASSKGSITRAQVYRIIKKSEIYERKRDIKETAKMLVKNPNTPLEVKNSKVVNELAVMSK